MASDHTMMSETFSSLGKSSLEVSEDSKKNYFVNQPDESSDGWDELEVDGKAQKEVILQDNFLKALVRFNAGVSLAKIRRQYEKLGAKYSPVTFRKKWDELVKKNEE